MTVQQNIELGQSHQLNPFPQRRILQRQRELTGNACYPTMQSTHHYLTYRTVLVHTTARLQSSEAIRKQRLAKHYIYWIVSVYPLSRGMRSYVEERPVAKAIPLGSYG